MKESDISKFVDEALRWRVFHQTVSEAREAFGDVPPEDLQRMIDGAVEEIRAIQHRTRAKRR